MTTPYRARTEHWAQCKDSAGRWDDATAFHCLLELRARVEALECRDREDSDAWTGVRRANSELRARVEALEAGATCPHIVSSDEGTSYCGLAEQTARIGQSDVPANTSAFELSDDDDPIPQRPAPVGSLVERVIEAGPVTLLGSPRLTRNEASSIIRAVAEWLRGHHADGDPVAATALEREAR